MIQYNYVCIIQVHHQDILSQRHVLDSLTEHAQSLDQSSSETPASRRLEDIKKQYLAVCETSAKYLETYESNVAEHQQYEDVHRACCDWLTAVKEKVKTCNDTKGDKYALQSKLDKLQVSLKLTFCHQSYI